MRSGYNDSKWSRYLSTDKKMFVTKSVYRDQRLHRLPVTSGLVIGLPDEISPQLSPLVAIVCFKVPR